MTVRAPASNAEFLAAIFGSLAPDERPTVCAFAGPPATGIWGGWPWSPGAACDGPALNWYFTLAVHRPDAGGAWRRTIDQCSAIYGVLADDIGTKAAPRARLDPLPPSVLIETSAGNYQALYLFAEPVTDLGRVAALQDALIAAGLCDRNAKGPAARYCRLPFGVNGKHTPAHPCRLVEWRPEARYTMEEITSGLALPALTMRPPREAVPAHPVDLDVMDAAQRTQLLGDLRSALELIPMDAYEEFISTGQNLRGLGDAGFALWFQAISKSGKFDDASVFRWETFDGKRSDYRAIFTKAKGYGWVNPRSRGAHDLAAIFSGSKELPAGASATPPHLRPRRYELNPDDPYNGARALIQRRFTHADGATLKAWQNTFYRWDAARWIEMDTATDVRAELYDFLDREGETHYRPTQSKVSNLLDALKAAAHLDSHHAPPDWIGGEPLAPASELLPCANGLLHLKTRTMLPATPRFFAFNAVPFAYEPQAAAPVAWLQFLQTVWPNDPEAIGALQEVFGYLLTPDTSQQKIFLIIGPKRSGKGTIARVLTEMLGAANVAGPSLASLANDFGLQPLIGKQVAIVSDARLGGQTDAKRVAETMLRVSGEDRVDVARKNTSSLSMRMGVRFVLLTNELPRIADASGAMASRFVILTMAESFLGREDPGLTAKLLQELPGILAWAVDGWHRFNARGHFIEPKSSAGTAQELADLGSPIAAFVRDECVTGATAEIETGALYLAWTTWCARQGMQHPGTLQTLGRDLRAAFPGITQSRPRVDGARQRVYQGIGLRGPNWSASHPIANSPAVTGGVKL
ncbi:phage/plasmid primase, P4 family [Rhizobacter fulvus]